MNLLDDQLYKKYFLTEEPDRLLVTWNDLYQPKCLSHIRLLLTGRSKESYFDIKEDSGFNHFECYIPCPAFDNLLSIVKKEKFYRIRDNSLDEYVTWGKTWNKIRYIKFYNKDGSIFFKEKIIVNNPEPKEEELIEIDVDLEFYGSRFAFDPKEEYSKKLINE